MPQVINTNIMSLNAQRQLNKSQATQNQAMERLSSGLRINSAKDDAAGLAISTGMQSQIRGITQAVRNSNDGVSMAQTAEGSMDEMTNILQRMRELSVQSANATNSSDNRESIQLEVDQLYAELGRISETTQFNGINLLDGSSTDVTLQIGANSGETMTIDFQDVTAHALGIDGGVTKGDLNGDRVDGGVIPESADIQINGIDIGPVENTNKLGAAGIAEAVNKKTSETNVTASAYNSIEGAKGDAFTGETRGLEIKVGGDETITIGTTNSMENLRDTINTAVSSINATISAEGQLQLTNDTGEKIQISSASGGDISASGLEEGTFEGYVALSSTGSEPIKVSGDDTGKFGFMETNGASSIQGGTIAADSSISEDDSISINGEELVVQGAIIDIAAESPSYTAATTAEKVAAINTLTEETGVTATLVEVTAADPTFTLGTRSTRDITLSDADITSFKADTGGLGITFDSNAVDMTKVTDVDSLVAELNSGSTTHTFEKTATGLTITAGTIGTTDALTLATTGTAATAGAIVTQLTTGSTTNTGTAASATGAGIYTISLTATEGTDIIVTSDAVDSTTQSAALDKLGMISTGGAKADDLGIDVTTADHASRSLDLIDEALGTISAARADLGAVQNRLDSTIANLENVSQNLSASNSRIQDADFAAETSKMSKAQILQQAGTSMLSQANASTQNVLSLLQG